MRKAVATALCVAGALLSGYVGARHLAGALRADALRQQWEEQEARAAVAEARSTAASATVAALGGITVGAPVARIRIPRIRLDEIVVEGVGEDELNASPGHLPGSAMPGMPGNAVISAHRDRHFSKLDELQLGDTIRTETNQSAKEWVIVARRIVARDAPALFKAKEPLLTLTTCWPVRYFGDAPDRLILSAKPIGT